MVALEPLFTSNCSANLSDYVIKNKNLRNFLHVFAHFFPFRAISSLHFPDFRCYRRVHSARCHD
jgi:hypothetical protein